MSRIMIAMPTMGVIKTLTVESLFVAIDSLKHRGHQVGFFHVESADITLSRNYLASLALSEAADTLFFIDADMTFTAEIIHRILDHEASVVGAICPKRKIDLEQLVRLSREERDSAPDVIISRCLTFPVREAAAQPGDIPGAFRLTRLGMAMTAIRVDVLRTLIDRGVASRIEVPMRTEIPTWGFFDPILTGGSHLSEDYSFCSRWVDTCGGEIWGLSTSQVGHIGDLVHAGEYSQGRPPA